MCAVLATLLLIILPHAAFGDSGCFWLGTAPVCKPDPCPAGTTEVAQSRKTQTRFADFGGGCWYWYSKRLCCNNDVVHDDPYRQCSLCAGCKYGTCPAGQLFLFDQIIEDHVYAPLCCIDGALAIN
ncbi:hypothetical protein PRIPAC_90700 [Pristionchus pacificus]|uniref:Uncharacterized protein n=1 Tax=Pristionchus pacificus TaxID=54126 RepID=A0A2A6CVZ6_PRIPA|nr:hypothetical protein PRIPAC_90700 [Pristionchus pacificus]|eukprot:PDM82404.1 hypothetical protein PRIPAC_36797 [Pristionchus pacificus]